MTTSGQGGPSRATPRESDDTEYVPPRDDLERALVACWSRVLGVAGPGVRDNLYGLGGDSLAAARISVEARAAIGVELTLAQVLTHPTVERLAAEIVRAGPTVGDRIEPAAPRAAYPLSPQQRRVLAEQATDPTSARYLLPVRVPLPPGVDPDRLTDAVRAAVARHEILRTAFGEHDGEPAQLVRPAVPFEPGAAGPFDLGRPPLLRAAVRGRVLELDLHHVVTDGVSLGLLLAEIDADYAGRPPVEPPLHYKDYAVWLAGESGRAHRAGSREWWARELAALPTARVPTDGHRTPGLPDTGAVEVFALGAERTALLSDLAAAEGVTLYTVLAAAYAVLLGAVTGSEDVVAGTPVAGRDRPELATVQGMFVETLCLRMRPERGLIFLDLLQDVAATTAAAFAHQGCPLDELPGGAPFDTLFALQHAALLEIDFLGHRVELELTPTGAAMFDLDLQVYERPGGLVAEWAYRTVLFRPETVRGLRDLLLLVLDRALADPTTTVADLTAVDAGPTPVPAFDFEF